MSRTYRRTSRGNKKCYLPDRWETYCEFREQFPKGWAGFEACNIAWAKLIDEHPELDEYFMGYRGMSSDPSWWAHDYFTVPQRREVRRLLKKIQKGELDPDNVSFNETKKGMPYYW